MISNEDAEMARVIEQSIQDSHQTGAFEPLNPNQRMRDEGVPCGLKNIGNSKFNFLFLINMIFFLCLINQL